MDENTKEKLTGYLELLNEITDKQKNEHLAAAVLSEVAKDMRMERMKEEREVKNNEPATEKQKKFMKNLGINFPKSVTKKEAIMLIDEELGKNNNSV